MNKLDTAARTQILHLLCEGSSIRAGTRVTGASKNTVIKLLIDAGKACAAYHDEHVRCLKSKRIQVDEIWSFTYAKEKNVPTAKAAPDEAGDTWTWTAIDADSSRDVSLPGAGPTDQHDVVAIAQELAAVQLAHQGLIDFAGGKIEPGQILVGWEASRLDLIGDRADLALGSRRLCATRRFIEDLLATKAVEK